MRPPCHEGSPDCHGMMVANRPTCSVAEPHLRMLERFIVDEVKIEQLHHHVEPTPWLSDDPSKALLACIGAGPWKAARRLHVQERAIGLYEESCSFDLRSFDPPLGLYPLAWQNAMVGCAVRTLRRLDVSLHWGLRTYLKDPRLFLFEVCGAGSMGVKVLWLFVRDYLKLDAFPIDRHVKRKLAEHWLPDSCPWYIIKAARELGINPSALNRYLAGVTNLPTGHAHPGCI